MNDTTIISNTLPPDSGTYPEATRWCIYLQNSKPIPMKYVLLVAVVAALTFSAKAQIQNETYTDCNGNIESIYGIIGQGKPLLIASKGFDCSICMSQAPGIKTFSEQHPNIRIWGAMGFRYSSAQPTCTGVNDWKNDYAWNDIFMFPDVNEDWEGSGYPTYYVISPLDSSIQYQGASFTQASAKALELAPTGIIEKAAGRLSAYFDAPARTLQVRLTSDEQIQTVMLANLMGQVVVEIPVQAIEKTLRIPISGNVTNGIYLVFLRNASGKMYSSKILVQ